MNKLEIQNKINLRIEEINKGIKLCEKELNLACLNKQLDSVLDFTINIKMFNFAKNELIELKKEFE